MTSRSKKHQAERLRLKRLWEEAEAAGALIGVDHGYVRIDANKLEAWRIGTGTRRD